LRLDPAVRLCNAVAVNRWLVLAALSTRFVRRQIRARQFSADIIDKVGTRHLEVRVPIPRDEPRRTTVSAAVKNIVRGQTRVRAMISELIGSDMRMSRERSEAQHGFSISRSAIVQRILIPKYYDPTLHRDLKIEAQRTQTDWIPLGSLIDSGLLIAGTGVEVGKMSYGTGPIPFVRTTDVAEMELKTDPRQGVSKSIYDRYARKAALAEFDVIIIRDGTYLVGSSAIVTPSDLPALICGGIYRLRSENTEKLSPYTLLALLNLPLVRRQMRARQFTRDVIDTLGKRLFEVRIPDPHSAFATNLGTELAALMRDKERLRSDIVDVMRNLEPAVPAQSRNRPGWSMRA
jgi:hypothetical protein